MVTPFINLKMNYGNKLIYVNVFSVYVFKVKQIMEEAVTRKFVHEESSSITSLCGEFYLPLYPHTCDKSVITWCWPVLLIINLPLWWVCNTSLCGEFVIHHFVVSLYNITLWWVCNTSLCGEFVIHSFGVCITSFYGEFEYLPLWWGCISSLCVTSL